MTTPPNRKRGEVAQGGSLAKALKHLNDEKNQDKHSLEVSYLRLLCFLKSLLYFS